MNINKKVGMVSLYCFELFQIMQTNQNCEYLPPSRLKFIEENSMDFHLNYLIKKSPLLQRSHIFLIVEIFQFSFWDFTKFSWTEAKIKKFL